MKRLEPIDDRYKIGLKSDGHVSEFEIQAHIFWHLRNMGYKVRGEVGWFDSDTRVHCRFDLVIYDDEKPIHIVEVKANPVRKPKTKLEDTRQGRRYRLFGIPATFVYGLDDAILFLSEMKHG